MAKETFPVIWDLQRNPNYSSINNELGKLPAKQEFKKGETLTDKELISGKEIAANVWDCKFAFVVAESNEEAMKVVQALYGSKTGLCGAAKAEKELEFKSVML